MKNSLQIRETAPGLTPAARPVDTYVRPAAPSVGPAPQDGQDLMALAQSLSSIVPSLGRYAGVLDKEARNDAAKEAQTQMASMTFEEADQKMREGKLLISENPYVNEHLSIHFGQMLAERRYNDLIQRQAGVSTSQDPSQPNFFDREKGQDVETWAKGEMSQDLQRLQGNEAKAAYASVMEKGLGHLRSMETQRNVQVTEAHAETAAFDTLYRTAKGAISQGGGKYNADALAVDMQAQYPALKKVYGLDDDKLDGAMLRVIPTLAKEGHFGLVEALFRGNDRLVARAGAEAPQLLEEAKSGWLKKARADNITSRVYWHDQANQGLINEAEFAAWRKANPSIVADHEAEAYILHGRQVARANQEAVATAAEKAAKEAAYQQQEQRIDEGLQQVMDRGGLPFLRPVKTLTKTGEPSEYGDSALRERAVANFLDDILPRRTALWAQQNGVAPDSPQAKEWAFNHRLSVISGNGVKDPQWEQLLHTGVAVANNPNLTAQNIPPALTSGYGLYKQLVAKAPHTLGQLLPDRDATELYEAARVGEQRLGMGERDALVWASNIQRGTAKGDPDVLRLRIDDLKTNLDKVRDQGLWSRMFGPAVVNANVAADDFERLSKLYVKLGLTSNDAMKTAADRLKGQYVNINGWLINAADGRIKTFGQNLAASNPNVTPTSFEDAFKGYIENWVTQGAAKARDLGAGDVGVVEVNPGVYMLVGSKGLTKGQPLIDFDNPHDQSYFVTLDQLMRHEGQRQLTKRAETMAKTEKAQAEKYDPWWVGENSYVGPFNITGFSPEETKTIDQRAGEIRQRQAEARKRPEEDAARFGGRKH